MREEVDQERVEILVIKSNSSLEKMQIQYIDGGNEPLSWVVDHKPPNILSKIKAMFSLA